VKLLCETLDVEVAWVLRLAQASDESPKAEKMATSPNAFKRRTMPIEGSMGVRACMQSYKLRGSRARGIRVARLMRELELAARRPRHRTKTTRSDPNARVVPNRLDRDFAATRPDEKWAGDITAIWTYEGWLPLAAVLDLFSRRVARLGYGRIG
jgi:transposase InsO family protein